MPLGCTLMSASVGQTTGVGDRLLGVLREVLDLTGRAARRRLDRSFWFPRPTSTFGADLANTEIDVHGAPWGSQEPTMAFEMAQLSMIMIDDYLTSIRKLLEPPFPPLVNGHELLPTGGHLNSPPADTVSPHTGGQETPRGLSWSVRSRPSPPVRRWPR